MKNSPHTNNPTQSLPIQVSETDKKRLEHLIAEETRRAGKRDDLSSLIAELERATVVRSGAVSSDVVAMNSTVSIIDQDTSEQMKFTLVYPEDADADHDRISIFSPIGSAMLGYKVGDEIQWAVPAGIRKFVVSKVDPQPEAGARVHA